jgi:hypothetical protein
VVRVAKPSKKKKKEPGKTVAVGAAARCDTTALGEAGGGGGSSHFAVARFARTETDALRPPGSDWTWDLTWERYLPTPMVGSRSHRARTRTRSGGGKANAHAWLMAHSHSARRVLCCTFFWWRAKDDDLGNAKLGCATGRCREPTASFHYSAQLVWAQHCTGRNSTLERNSGPTLRRENWTRVHVGIPVRMPAA